jgi:hypothetical protein
VSIIVKHEEYLFRVIDDTGDRSSIIIEAYTSASFIKTDHINTTIWSTMGGKFTTTKTELTTFSSPELNFKKRFYTSWAFHMDYLAESSSKYSMIIGTGMRYRTRHINELQGQYGHLRY